jgi:hypothetical protein
LALRRWRWRGRDFVAVVGAGAGTFACVACCVWRAAPGPTSSAAVGLRRKPGRRLDKSLGLDAGSRRREVGSLHSCRSYSCMNILGNILIGLDDLVKFLTGRERLI